MSSSEMQNKSWAEARFYSLKLNDTPYLVGYWKGDKLLLHSMNLPAVKLFGYPSDAREAFIEKHTDSDVAFLFEGDSYDKMLTCDGDEFSIDLDCRKGTKRVTIVPFCEESGVVFKIQKPSVGFAPVLAKPEMINNFLKGWIEVLKTSRTIVLAIASGIMGITGMAIWSPWAQFTPTEVQAQKDDTKEQVEQILLNEVDKLPHTIDHNGVTVSKYLDNLSSRQLYTGYIKGLGPLDRKSIEVKSTNEDGWIQQLKDHLPSEGYPTGKTHIIRIEDFKKKDPNHALVVAMRKGGAVTLISVPIYRESRLVGYVAIGLREKLADTQMSIVKDRLKTISLRIAISTGFPS